MPKWVYKKRRIFWEDDAKSVPWNKITEEQLEKLVTAIEHDFTITEACAEAGVSRQTYQNYYRDNEMFRWKIDFAKSKLVRDAKTKVHEWVENDETWEFSLKVLKARCPEQYNTQRIESKHEVIAEVEHKTVDEMLVEYYAEE